MIELGRTIALIVRERKHAGRARRTKKQMNARVKVRQNHDGHPQGKAALKTL